MHIMKDRSVQELRAFLDVSTLQDEDITLPRNVGYRLLSDTESYRRRTECYANIQDTDFYNSTYKCIRHPGCIISADSMCTPNLSRFHFVF